MKKNTIIIISIIAVILLGVIAYLVFGTTKSNEIELTLDNYSDYLEISVVAIGSRDIVLSEYLPFYIGSERVTATRASTSCMIHMTVKGVSSNYKYSDITVGVKVGGFYYSCPLSALTTTPKLNKHNVETIKCELVCDLNVSGNGKAEEIVYNIPNNEVVPEDWYYKAEGFSVEICSISGSITPTK